MRAHVGRSGRDWRVGVPVFVAMAVGAGGCMSPSADSASTPDVVASGAPSAAAEDVCPTAGAQVGVGPVDAATGERAATLTLVNCGSVPYRVEGYPGLELLDEEQQVIDVRLVQEPDPIGNGAVTGPAPLSLEPGEQAHAVLLWRNTVEMGPSTPGSYLAVAPAPSEAPQVVPLNVDLGTTGLLTVGPWMPAA